MPAWGNGQNLPAGFQHDQNMESLPGNTLTVVDGLTTLGGGLNVGPANNELQILSNANESRIERQGGETTLFINADGPMEGGDVVISHPDNPGVSSDQLVCPAAIVFPSASAESSSLSTDKG